MQSMLLNAESLEKSDVASSAAQSIQQSKLMIVDDEPINIMAVKKHLTGLGYSHFVTTSDALQALPLLKESQPDLLLLDIKMPGISGLEILEQLRAEVAWATLPVIILTAFDDPQIKRQALETGATDFLSKPVDPHELSLRVRNVLVAMAYHNHVAKRAHELADEVDRQAQKLELAKQQAELRYLAGKAEIATDVLHNVGNALNSVKTGVGLARFKLKTSKLPSLQQAVELLRQHGDDRASFLTEDKRGRLLPSYLCELTEVLLDEREQLDAEMQNVSKHLDHISAVVSTQQQNAANCSLIEEVCLAELIRDAEELVGTTCIRHAVEVSREYRPIRAVATDRQRLMQVLVNVLKNAIESVVSVQSTGLGQLNIRIGERSPRMAFIEIEDNGAGVREEDLLKVFSHGFSTKSDGHGFGLHSSAIIMHELGGSIQIQSEGPGCGATVTIECPFFERGTQR